MKSNREQHSEDHDIEQILRAVGRREPLPESLKSSWEATVRDELGAVMTRRRRRRNLFATGIAATVALAAALMTVTLAPQQALPVVSRVAYVHGEVSVNGQPAVPGQALAPGDALVVAADAALSLVLGGYDLRLRHGSELEIEGAVIRLARGALYADSDFHSTTISQLTVVTPHAAIRNTGTQFIVETDASGSRALVRRGALAIEHAGVTTRLTARGGLARGATLSPERPADIIDIPSQGDSWSWIHASTPTFPLEGTTAYDFLVWQARENGFDLLFTTPGSELYAKTTTLQGDIGNLSPLEALDPVLLATDLRASIVQGTLRVSLEHSY